MRNLCLIFPDQLNHEISSLEDFDQNLDEILICEFKKDFDNVNHHKKKIVYQISCMRHFNLEMVEMGYTVNYIKLNDPNNKSNHIAEILTLVKEKDFKKIILTEPSTYDEVESIKKWQEIIGINIEVRKNNLFICDKKEFELWAEGRKELRLEFFYRMLRKKLNILMDDEKPTGDRWNFDKSNRKPFRDNITIPDTYISSPDKLTTNIINLVNQEFPEHFGKTDNFIFAVTRADAIDALTLFVKERLKYFGDYQDAMTVEDPWLFHCHLSMYLNNGLIKPIECLELAERAYRDSNIPINSVEGFTRQILGWREYVRGLYWLKMPDYRTLNSLNAKLDLPSFYWDGETNMNCIKLCVENTKDNAYAHHIQRLMILGNFALISGINPIDVNDWFLSVYADAYEWVELPNVTGMALYADDGIMASKPYAASGAYIKRMSNYCDQCHYDVKEKTGEKACPFNYLYWNFLDNNKNKLSKNPRLGLAYRNLNNMPNEKLKNVKKSAHTFFVKMKNNEKI